MAGNIQDIFESLQNFDTDQLNDLNAVGSWPMAVKVIIWLIVFAGAIAAGYFVHVTNLQSELAGVQKKEVQLRQEFEDKFFEAAHLMAIAASRNRWKNRLKRSYASSQVTQKSQD